MKVLVDWRETVLGQHPCHHAVITRRWILPNETITALSVEQTQGQRQTGRNDLPGKGERVASGW